jgi:hypothetical protein
VTVWELSIYSMAPSYGQMCLLHDELETNSAGARAVERTTFLCSSEALARPSARAAKVGTRVRCRCRGKEPGELAAACAGQPAASSQQPAASGE